eukprot:427564_1
MSTLVSINGIDNILLCGYVREYELKTKDIIPSSLQIMICMYCKEYYVHTISVNKNNNTLKLIKDFNAFPNDIYIGGSVQNNADISFIRSIGTSQIASEQILVYKTDNNLYQLTSCTQKPYINISKQINTTETFLNSCDKIIDIQCGLNHTLFLTKCGNLYSFGDNDVGQCGLNRKKYTRLSTPKLIMQSVKSIACGSFHNLIINTKQELLVNGYNFCGQLGLKQDDIDNNIQINECPINKNKNTIKINDGKEYKDELQETELSLFNMTDSSDDDTDWMEEINESGNTLLFVDIPTIHKYFVDIGAKVSAISAGEFHSVCVTSDGKCITFGHNYFGNLGNGNISEWGVGNTIPQLLDIDEFVIDSACGGNHTLLLTKSNDIMSFGNNLLNQCSTVNNNKRIMKPYMLLKDKEFSCVFKPGYDFVEKIICLKDESLVFFNKYKKKKNKTKLSKKSKTNTSRKNNNQNTNNNTTKKNKNRINKNTKQ